MNRSLFKISKSSFISCLALLLAIGPVAAGSMPKNLSDLIYQDAGWGSGQMRSRGYTLISSHGHGGQIVEYWWNAKANTCVLVRGDDGKYESATTTSSTDCNQYHSEAISGGSAAAIALGAAAIIGVAALAHKSHERDEEHSRDSQSVAEFERGYRDGLHHERYHNYSDSKAYANGYTAGQRERDEQTRHQARHGHHSGYTPYVSVNDLVGISAAGADNDMRARGFRDTGGYKQGNKSFTTWWNSGTRQCVQMVTKNGKVKHIEPINEGNCL